MLSKEVSAVLNHYLREGLSKAAIARKLGINRRAVHHHAKEGKTGPEYKPRPPAQAVVLPSH